ncbi:hypothetical protein NL676_008834, partial [Syzygium grande]
SGIRSVLRLPRADERGPSPRPDALAASDERRPCLRLRPSPRRPCRRCLRRSLTPTPTTATTSEPSTSEVYLLAIRPPPRPPVPTSAVASFRPRAAGSRALTAVASAAKPSSVLLPNGHGWGSGRGLFFVDFVGLCCKYKWARRRLGVSRSRGHPRLLSAGKPAPPSSVKAVLHLERAGHSSSPAASRLVGPGQASGSRFRGV